MSTTDAPPTELPPALPPIPGAAPVTSFPADTVSTPIAVADTGVSPETWDGRVGAFAKAVSKTIDAVNTALGSLVGTPSAEALEILSDSTAVPDSDLLAALCTDPSGPKIPSGVFRKHLPKLRGAQPSKVIADAAAAPIGSIMLPAAPDDDSFLKMLQVGGVPKVDDAAVISAVKTALASRIGLFNIPKILLREMEIFATVGEEQVPPEYYVIERLVTRRKYADVLDAIGVPGSFITSARRTEFLGRMETVLWPALISFHSQLTAWYKSWAEGMTGGAMMGVLLLGQMTGGGGGLGPNPLLAPPDTGVIRSAASAFIDKVNRTFAGHGVPVSRALAYDAGRLRDVLANSQLPLLIGVPNREAALKKLGIAVSEDVVRMESALVSFVLAVMKIPDISVSSELAYLTAIMQLGAGIPWDTLKNSTPVSRDGGGANLASAGRRRDSGSDDDYIVDEDEADSQPRRR